MKVLLIRFSSAGDIVATTCAVRCLRAAYPDAEIDFLTLSSYAGLVSMIPFIDRILTIERRDGWSDLVRRRREIRAANYNVVVDLHSSLRSRTLSIALPSRRVALNKPLLRRVRLRKRRRHVALRYLDTLAPIGVVDDGGGLELSSSVNKGNLPNDLGRPIVVLAPGAQHRSKRWDPERFADVGIETAGADGTIVILGGSDDRERSDVIERRIARQSAATLLNLTDATDWPETVAVIAGADVVLANDSVASHIAAAVGTPVATIYTSTAPSLGFTPFRAACHLLEPAPALSCRPCTTTGRADCRRGDFACLDRISVTSAVEATRDLLDSAAEDRP